MKELQYIAAKIIGKLRRDKHKETVHRFFTKQGIKIGRGCNVCCNIVTPESQLILLGDKVTVAGDVEFVTHDNSISKVLTNTTDLFGKIVIGNNCFIGARSVILYGIELADNIIVAAGSVVCNSFHEERIIIGGNPARKIGTWDSFAAKSKDYAWNLDGTSLEEKNRMLGEGNKLIRRG